MTNVKVVCPVYGTYRKTDVFIPHDRPSMPQVYAAAQRAVDMEAARLRPPGAESDGFLVDRLHWFDPEAHEWKPLRSADRIRSGLLIGAGGHPAVDFADPFPVWNREQRRGLDCSGSLSPSPSLSPRDFAHDRSLTNPSINPRLENLASAVRAPRALRTQETFSPAFEPCGHSDRRFWAKYMVGIPGYDSEGKPLRGGSALHSPVADTPALHPALVESRQNLFDESSRASRRRGSSPRRRRNLAVDTGTPSVDDDGLLSVSGVCSMRSPVVGSSKGMPPPRKERQFHEAPSPVHTVIRHPSSVRRRRSSSPRSRDSPHMTFPSSSARRFSAAQDDAVAFQDARDAAWP
ncbi:hypothetical protein DIPPA_13949 [Diplonema papillatum]|nr:hypothetical protein DIPPA_13949 [Diplonema papillatum]